MPADKAWALTFMPESSCISLSAAWDALGRGKVRHQRKLEGRFVLAGLPSGGFGDSPKSQHLQLLTQAWLRGQRRLSESPPPPNVFLHVPQTGYALCVPISPLGNLISDLSWNGIPLWRGLFPQVTLLNKEFSLEKQLGWELSITQRKCVCDCYRTGSFLTETSEWKIAFV